MSTTYQPAEVLKLVDFTSLNHDDTFESIERFCVKALELKTVHRMPVAALCVYPVFLEMVKSIVSYDYPVAVVAGGFPHAQLPFRQRMESIVQCAQMGADEIDFVVPYHQIKAGYFNMIERETQAINAAIGFRTTKVILETCYLTPDEIQQAGMAVLNGGANFVKTSTGKGAGGADLESTQAIIDALKAAPELRGIKVAGAVRTMERAKQYMDQFQYSFGEAALTPSHFRFGSSSLIDQVLENMNNASS